MSTESSNGTRKSLPRGFHSATTLILGELTKVNTWIAGSNDQDEIVALTEERDELQTALAMLKREPFPTPASDPKGADGVTDVKCSTSLRGNDGTSGAHFGWRCKLTDGTIRERALAVEVHVVPAGDVEKNEREGLFAYWKQIDMGNGYFAVCSLRFDGEIENMEHPNLNDRELMRPFKTALHDFLEQRDDVGYLEMATFVNGGARFEFQVVGAPDGCTPDLRLTLERGDS
jgi:hypothetical protein